jgi:hypothetical protein
VAGFATAALVAGSRRRAEARIAYVRLVTVGPSSYRGHPAATPAAAGLAGRARETQGSARAVAAVDDPNPPTPRTCFGKLMGPAAPTQAD